MARNVWLSLITALTVLAASSAALARPPTTYRLTHICTNDPANPSVGCNVHDINNKGELVGSRPLDGVPQGAVGGNAWAINDRGSIVGVAFFPERTAGYRWKDGQATELPSTPSLTEPAAFDINNRGAIVGGSLDSTDQQFVATLWARPGDRPGDPIDLNTRIADDDPLRPFVHLGSANLINDRGAIVASGHDSRNHPFAGSHYLLTPEH